jgi:hypothetical protein
VSKAVHTVDIGVTYIMDNQFNRLAAQLLINRDREIVLELAKSGIVG